MSRQWSSALAGSHDLMSAEPMRSAREGGAKITNRAQPAEPLYPLQEVVQKHFLPAGPLLFQVQVLPQILPHALFLESHHLQEAGRNRTPTWFSPLAAASGQGPRVHERGGWRSYRSMAVRDRRALT